MGINGSVGSGVNATLNPVDSYARGLAAGAPAAALAQLAIPPRAVTADSATSVIGNAIAALPPIIDMPSYVLARGDSNTVGFGLTPPAVSWFGNLANYFGFQANNFGVSSSGVSTAWSSFLVNTLIQAPTDDRLTLWLAGYNDMRVGGLTAGRLAAYRDVFTATLLLHTSRFSALRQFYGTDYAAGNGFSLTGSWGISLYGTTATVGQRWRGVSTTTSGNTVSATVSGDVVYVVYDKQTPARGNGGTFSVSVDGAVVVPNVSCDATNYALGGTVNNMDTAGYGFPAVLRIPTAPGNHTVTVTVTSSSNAANIVQIETITGNLNVGGAKAPRVLVGGPARQNATGITNDGVYASKAAGDAAVNAYRAIMQTAIEQLASDGYNVGWVDIDGFDPSASGAMQSDNIHFSAAATGHPLIAAAFAKKLFSERVYGSREAPKVGYGSSPLAVTLGASPAAYQNTTRSRVTAMITGGTVSLVEWSRDGATYIGLGTSSAVDLSPGDYLRVTYSAAPTLYSVGR